MSLQVPSPPGDEDEDFILVHHSDVQLSDKAEQVYAQLMKMLREQYEVRLQEGDWRRSVQLRLDLTLFSLAS